MKDWISGFEFDSPNKGCEALGYSFVSLIKKNYPDKVEFYVFTNDEWDCFRNILMIFALKKFH